MQISERLMLPLNISYNLAGIYYAFIEKTNRHYWIEVEEIELDDDFAGIFIANIPGNGGSVPASEARFNDGYMDMYVIKQIPRNLFLQVIQDYQSGQYARWPEYVSHYRCKKLRITSATDMTMILDGETFYDSELNLEIHPASLNFVCPFDIDISILEQPPVELTEREEINIADFL
jgi:diacylglycerol kinase family enzyme